MLIVLGNRSFLEFVQHDYWAIVQCDQEGPSWLGSKSSGCPLAIGCNSGMHQARTAGCVCQCNGQLETPRTPTAHELANEAIHQIFIRRMIRN